MKILRSGLVGVIAFLGLGTLGGCYGGYYAAHPGYYSPSYQGGYYAAHPGHHRPYRGGYTYYNRRPGYHGHRVAAPPPYRGAWRGPRHSGFRGHGHHGYHGHRH
jgi:hypothetical protein